MTLRRICGLLALGLFIANWLYLADMATGGCDDGCSGDGWSGDIHASQWATQLWIARGGAVLAAIAGVLWWVRWRTLSVTLAIGAAGLLFAWWPLAQEARFGPPQIAPQVYENTD
jgi:hypothetical protein